MDEILHVELTGKFNGRDASISIGLEAESAFEIEDMSTSGSADGETVEADSEQSVTAQAEADTAQPQPTKTGETETPDEPDEPDEPTGLDQLFPQNGFDEEELPTFTPGTKKHKVAKQALENAGTKIKVSELRKQLQDAYPDEKWSDSNVSSTAFNFAEDDIFEREKNDSDVWEYEVTDLGRATLKHLDDEDE